MPDAPMRKLPLEYVIDQPMSDDENALALRMARIEYDYNILTIPSVFADDKRKSFDEVDTRIRDLCIYHAQRAVICYREAIKQP